MSDLSSLSFSRILLIKPSSLGDVVHALPVLHGLRTRYPGAQIDWLISSALAPLLAGHRDIDELILFDRRRFGRLGRDVHVSRDFVRYVRGLRARRYELAVDLQGLLRTGFLSWVCGAGVRIGLKAAREGASIFYSHRVSVDGPDVHAVDRNYAVGRLLGFSDLPVRFDLALNEESRNEARNLLSGLGLGGKKIIVFAPGARWETKVWPSDRFIAAINALTDRFAAGCVLVGSPDERSRCEQIAAGCRADVANLAGKTSLPVLPAVLELSDVVLCHDSAVMHLAVALNKAVICLIGPTNPQRTGPYRRSNAVLQLPLDCSPCYLRRLSQCRHQHRCMKELATSTVVDAVASALVASSVKNR